MDAAFLEAPVWKSIGQGWRPLFGHYRELGFSFEWHDFKKTTALDWGKSFHPGSIELCLNLQGHGTLTLQNSTVTLPPQCYAFYYQGQPPLQASRLPNEHHRFITIEYSPIFLQENLPVTSKDVHPLVQEVLRQQNNDLNVSRVAPAERLVATLQQLVASLRHCPVFHPARELWFRSKALEVAAHLFFQPANGELLCTRTQRLARERIEKARGILQENLQNPPSLEDLARQVNCSPYYLSRQFAQESGVTMQHYIRELRMERAAELLRTGQCNVTEAAMEVGYNSLSHFSSTFRETFGCCPGLYPLKIPGRK